MQIFNADQMFFWDFLENRLNTDMEDKGDIRDIA
jgi:hypothetical protein